MRRMLALAVMATSVLGLAACSAGGSNAIPASNNTTQSGIQKSFSVTNVTQSGIQKTFSGIQKTFSGIQKSF